MDLTELTERTAIQSPQRLRRALTIEDIQEMRELKDHLRYERGWDDSKFFTFAQLSQVEAKKILKMGALKNKK